MWTKAGLTIMEASHDQIKVESNYVGWVDYFHLLQAIEHRCMINVDGAISSSYLQLNTCRAFHS